MSADDDFLQDSGSSSFRIAWPPWYTGSGSPEAAETADLDAIIDAAFAIMSENLQGYQSRTAQVNMAKTILRAYVAGRHAAVEAGTGVGKSFAYLIAALAYSYLSGERVILATETRTLQLQLLEKDIPFLKRVLDGNLSYELCLGSSNYLCRLRYEDTFTTGGFLDLIEPQEVDAFHSWARTVLNEQRGFGTQFDAPDVSSGFWSRVNRDSDGCPGVRCHYYSSCNYYRAKKSWSESRLLVANHHLLLYHLINERRTLPSAGAIVIDEAHGIIKTGYNIFTLSLGINAVAERIRLWERMNRGNLPAEVRADIDECHTRITREWEDYCRAFDINLGLTFEEDGNKVIERVYPAPVPDQENLGKLLELLEDLKDNSDDSSVLNGLRAHTAFITRLQRLLYMYHEMDFHRIAYWVEKFRGEIRLYACRLNLGEQFSELLTEPAAWTSATLGFWPGHELPQRKNELIRAGYFRTFLSEVMPGRPDSFDLNLFFSPFDYKSHVALYIPNDIFPPEFGQKDQEPAYEKRLLTEIVKLVHMSNGGALVLFTSNYMAGRFTELLRTVTELNVISQTEDGPMEALAKFREDPEAVLIGTASFWQGVDVTGHGLRLTIITKLMFTPPEDPVFRARSVLLERSGQKPFFSLALPYAATMLRQAFGRLIRSETDCGVVAILDSRILQKSYGRTLLANLPATLRAETAEQLQELVVKHALFAVPEEKTKE